jgi:hypothetical protein
LLRRALLLALFLVFLTAFVSHRVPPVRLLAPLHGCGAAANSDLSSHRLRSR